MHNTEIHEIQHYIMQPDVQSVFTASESFHKIFGSGNYVIAASEDQRWPLQDTMNQHEDLISPAIALTIGQARDGSFSYEWAHKDTGYGVVQLCKGYVATTGIQFPGVHIFRLDDNNNTQIYRKRKSTRQFFDLITNIFLSDGVINNQFGGLNRDGDRIQDRAIVVTDYNYDPLSVCLFDEDSYSPNLEYHVNDPLSYNNLPWIPTFTALDIF